MNNKIFIFVFCVIVFVFGGLLYIYNPSPIEYKNSTEEPVVCTAEAKLCPDGSYVGRSGPNCEFKSCPDEKSLPPDAIFEDGTVDTSQIQ